MHVLSRRVLREFWNEPAHRDAEEPLKAWHATVEASTWRTFADVKAAYRSADAVGDDRIVFNIGGNKYRLVAAVSYERGIVYVKFVGTHADYDRIDARDVGRPA